MGLVCGILRAVLAARVAPDGMGRSEPLEARTRVGGPARQLLGIATEARFGWPPLRDDATAPTSDAMVCELVESAARNFRHPAGRETTRGRPRQRIPGAQNHGFFSRVRLERLAGCGIATAPLEDQHGRRIFSDPLGGRRRVA